jgi:hypothetical protein
MPDQSLILFSPRQPFLDWLNGISETKEPLELEMVHDDYTAYLLPPCDDREEALELIRPHAARFFTHLLYGWCPNQEYWPESLDFDRLCQWFEIRVAPAIFDFNELIAQ